jgi:CARDB
MSFLSGGRRRVLISISLAVGLIAIAIAVRSYILQRQLVALRRQGATQRVVFSQGAIIPPESAQQHNILEDPGKLLIMEGCYCTKSTDGNHNDVGPGPQGFLGNAGGLVLPDYATTATVFQQGWRLTYLNGDHHIRTAGSLIQHIRTEDGILKWSAYGGILDENGDDAFRWCYYYTVLAWNAAVIDAAVDHEDGHGDSVGIGGPTTVTRSYFQNPVFAGKRTTTALPRGFFFDFRGEIGFFGFPRQDTNLLQMAYNLDHTETFIEQGKTYNHDPQPLLPSPASQVDSGFLSWDTHGILKNNGSSGFVILHEFPSAIGGNDLGVIQPPFSILPQPSTDCPNIFPPGGVKTTEHVIEGVPFVHAIPLLTGWDLSYPCEDQNVKDIGVWITDAQYTKDPSAPTGTLRYKLSSVLSDEDNVPDHNVAHKVTILGIPPVSAKVTQPLADLTIIPAGNGTGLCQRDNQGRVIIRVKNQGTATALSSRTKVTFTGGAVRLIETPPIAAGGFVDLHVEVPSSCIGDCRFTVCADADNQVIESRKDNNCVTALCVG